MSERIKMTANQKVQEEEARKLYSMYNQDGATPLNIVPYGVSTEREGWTITVTVEARKKRVKK